MELEVALESDRSREAGRVEGLDLGQMGSIGGELPEHRLATAVAEQVVVLVETQGGSEHRVVPDETHEAALDEVVEAVVERAAVRRRRRAREDRLGRGVGHRRCTSERVGCPGGRQLGPGRTVDRADQAVTSGPAATGRGDVSARAARVAAIVASTSAAVTP